MAWQTPTRGGTTSGTGRLSLAALWCFVAIEAHGAVLEIQREVPVSERGRREWSALEIHGTLRFDRPGTYLVELDVRRSFDGCETYVPGPAFSEAFIAQPPASSHREANSGTETVQTDSLGVVHFVARVPGDGLSRFEVDGPWVCFVNWEGVGVSDSSGSDCLHASTRSWRWSGFRRAYRGEYEAHAWLSQDERVWVRNQDLLDVTVLTADSMGSKADPPRVRLRINERLYGAESDRELETRWSPDPFPFPCPVGEEENIRRWEHTPWSGPAVGSRWLVVGKRASGRSEWVMEPLGHWPFTVDARDGFRRRSRTWPARVRELRERYEDYLRESADR